MDEATSHIPKEPIAPTEVDAAQRVLGTPPRIPLEHLMQAGEAEVVDRYQQKYEARRTALEGKQAYLEEQLPGMAQRAERNIAAYREKFGRPPEEGTLDGSLIGARRSLSVIKDKLDFLRPSSDADIAYRANVMDNLARRVKEVAPPGLPLRFHGCSIYAGRDILLSGEMSSSVDRLGISTSFDVSNQVSVTTPETIETTVEYTSLNEEEYCMPPGCIFVLFPKSSQEADAASSMLMHNVHFRDNPKQIFGIMTAPENIERMRSWAEASGIDPSKVQEFFGFCDQLGQLKADIAEGKVNPQDFVPYDLSAAHS